MPETRHVRGPALGSDEIIERRDSQRHAIAERELHGAREHASVDDVAQLRYTALMKTATIPAVRVEPEFRAEVESVLAEGESLSEFVEASVRTSVNRRLVQAEFVARGLRSRDEAKRTGDYVDADDVVAALQRKVAAARARVPKTRK